MTHVGIEVILVYACGSSLRGGLSGCLCCLFGLSLLLLSLLFTPLQLPVIVFVELYLIARKIHESTYCLEIISPVTGSLCVPAFSVAIDLILWAVAIFGLE